MDSDILLRGIGLMIANYSYYVNIKAITIVIPALLLDITGLISWISIYRKYGEN